MSWKLAWIPVLVLALATPAAADVLLLKDGRIIERPKMERVENGVKVYFENGEVIVPDKMISEAIFESGLAFEPKTDAEKEKAAKGLVPFQGKWVKKDKAASLMKKYVADRKAAVEEVRHHMLWRNRRKSNTKHFAFEYTVPPEVYQYYADLMEVYFKLFQKTWKIKGKGKLKVCFYTDREKMVQIGGAGPGALGYFRFVEPIELNFFYDRLDPQFTEQVMYHEANHYLTYLMHEEYKMPHFPGEAIAEYYGSGKYDPETKELTIGHILEGRLVEVQMGMKAGKKLGLEKMIKTSRMYEHYNWGWTLVHFLMSKKDTGKKFEKFVKRLVSDKKIKREPLFNMKTVPGPVVWEQFKKTFGLKTPDDIAEMETAWHKYVEEEMKVTSGRGLFEAARYAEREGLRLKAKRLYGEAIEKGSTSAVAHRKLAEFKRRDGEDAEAEKLLRKAITLAPLEPSLYTALGRIVREDDEEAGAKLLKLATELDPDNPWLEFEIEQILEDDDDE